jgi:hypothetical protein
MIGILGNRGTHPLYTFALNLGAERREPGRRRA